MRVILLENIRHLGKLGDEVSVKPGFGRNYLIPQGKALAATKVNVLSFEARRADLEKSAQERLSKAEQRAEQLTRLGMVEMSALAGEGGKLYGSLGPLEIARAVTNAGVEIAKREVMMPTGPLREVGEFTVEVQFESNVKAKIAIKVNEITE